MWTQKLTDHQGLDVKFDVILQDNTSIIKLLSDGRESSGKRTRRFDIRPLYIKDLIENGEAQVKHFPTERMIADHDDKPLVGGMFNFISGRCFEFKWGSSLSGWATGVLWMFK